MAQIITDASWNGKRVVKVTPEKARQVADQLRDMPSDLTDQQYTFLKAIEYIRFGDGSRFPALHQKSTQLTHDGIEQGSYQGVPVGDR